MSDEILTIEGACELLKISEKLLYQLAKEKDFPARKVGREWRFLKSELMDWFTGRPRIQIGSDFVDVRAELKNKIITWNDNEIQKCLKNISTSGLLLWMYDLEDEMREKFYRNMSKRAVDVFKEDLCVLEKGDKSESLKLLVDCNYSYLKAFTMRD